MARSGRRLPHGRSCADSCHERVARRPRRLKNQKTTSPSADVWSAVLCHPAIRQIKPGGFRHPALEGSLAPERLGLERRNRPAKLRESLERAVGRGSAVQDGLSLEVMDRSTRGFKLRVTRVSDRVSSGTLGFNPNPKSTVIDRSSAKEARAYSVARFYPTVSDPDANSFPPMSDTRT